MTSTPRLTRVLGTGRASACHGDVMVAQRVRGVRAMRNGRGPFVGRVKVHGHGRMQVIVGCDKMHKRLGNSPHCVCVVRASPPLGWFQSFNDPVQAETTGRLIEGLGDVRADQLEALGFTEERREVLHAISR